MANYSFRTDNHDENNLKLLTEEHCRRRIRRNTILRASLEAFKCMKKEEREWFLIEILSRDSRRFPGGR